MSIKTLSELIRIPSCSSKERDIQEHIKAKLEGFGLEPFFQGDNLLVHLKGADSTRAFIFNGHTDVVDPGDLSRWKNGNPWEPIIEDGRIFGRGASDMKAGVYTMMEVAKKMAKRKDLPVDVWFTFVVREETDGEGTKSFAKWFKENKYTEKYKEMTAIFAEPTSLNRAEHGHRGNYFIKAVVDGDAAHSSRPREIKRHAILLMTQFIQKLELECEKWVEEYKGREFAPATITPTAIKAESASPNKTSDCCTACFDLRTIPGFHEEAFARVKEMAGEFGIELSLIYPEAPVGYTSSEAKIIKAMRTLVPGLKLNVSQAAADLGFLSELGVEGVIFGPGEIELAHQINESASVNQILAAPALFEKIFDNWAKTV